MKLVFFSILLLPYIITEETCDQACDHCDASADIGKITCEPPAACKSAAGNTIDLSYLLEENELHDISATTCRALCQTQSEHGDTTDEGAEKACKYFHWEKEHERNNREKRLTSCSLQTDCVPQSTCDESYECGSGQLGCNDECVAEYPCSLTKTTWNHDNFHFVCTDVNSQEEVNIYTDDIVGKKLSGGTICKTVRKCSDWNDIEEAESDGKPYYRRLAVHCDGADGTWKALDETGSAEKSAALIKTAGDSNTPGSLEEQPCDARCPDLQLAKYLTQYWADVVCEIPLVDHTLTEPNSCILLCDNHFEKSIDCEFDLEGVKNWRDSEGEVLTDASIAC